MVVVMGVIAVAGLETSVACIVATIALRKGIQCMIATSLTRIVEMRL